MKSKRPPASDDRRETARGARARLGCLLTRLERRFSTGINGLCVTLLAAIVLTVFASVLTRFVVFYPLNFADALAKYLMMWMAFLGVSLALRKGEHIAVSFLSERLPGRARTVLLALVEASLALFFLGVIWFGTLFAWSGRSSSDPFVFGISMMIPYLSVPAGALCALVQLFFNVALRSVTVEPPRKG